MLGGIAPVTTAQVQIRVPETDLAVAQPVKAMHVDGVACPHLDPAELRTFSLLVGIPLSDVTDPQAGALRYLPGGHLSMARWFDSQWSLGMTDQVPQVIDAQTGIPFLCNVGDVLLMHHLVPHAVGLNHSATPRVMVYYRLSHPDHASRRLAALRDPWLDYPPLATSPGLAAQAIRAGQLVIAPTSRWYMICADAANMEACRSIFAGKRRPAGKSLVFIAPHEPDYTGTFAFNDDAARLAAALWPGDLALLLPWRDPGQAARHPAVGSPALVTRPGGVLGALAAAAQIPIAATTANISGDAGPQDRGPAITLAEVDEFLAESGLTAAVAIDGGICPAGSHMTIIDCSRKGASLTRAGMVHQRAIAAVLGRQL
jgi:L-threonylcarbamoyladenylate synthase